MEKQNDGLSINELKEGGLYLCRLILHKMLLVQKTEQYASALYWEHKESKFVQTLVYDYQLTLLSQS